jgi:cbb3-type cytochrome oxidase maturation protein
VESLYLLIPIALIFCIIAIKLLLWAINSGQYDDLDKEAWRILAEDDATETGAAARNETTIPDNEKTHDR